MTGRIEQEEVVVSSADERGGRLRRAAQRIVDVAFAATAPVMSDFRAPDEAVLNHASGLDPYGLAQQQ